MTITYSKLLKGYIATIRHTPSQICRMIAVKPTRAEVIAVALQKITSMK